MPTQGLPQKRFAKYRKPLAPLPHLVENQINSFKWFIEQGLKETIKEFFPLSDYAEKKFELNISDFKVIPPEFDETYAKVNKLTYAGELKATIVLKNHALKEVKEQEIMLTEIPFMTPSGSFIMNGVERIVVSQLARSYGVSFTEHDTKVGKKFGAKIIPERGAWVEMETEKDDVIFVRIDKKRKFPVTTLLRAFGLSADKDILEAFKNEEHVLPFIKKSLERDPAKSSDEAYVEIYKKLRDGEIATVENAREFFESMFMSDRYDISVVGRYHFNKRFELPTDKKSIAQPHITQEDLMILVKKISSLNIDPEAHGDDIDHLGSRRVRYVGELLQQKVRKGMSQMKRNIQDRMSTVDAETIIPINLVNQRPLQARIKEFFTTSQLSQFMLQENILGEIEHLRILSTLGPGGLTRERAGFEVRDVHPSHYGRVCPIHTPEGPNIGLILHMALYARMNEFGMIETPYIKVENGKITGEIEYMNAMDEEKYNIAHAGVEYDEKTGKITKDRVEGRKKSAPGLIDVKDVDYIDVATTQSLSVATSLIPFVENNDSNRALMGSNMQKQATPCIRPTAPLVATGMEADAARDTGRLILAQEAGEVIAVDARRITVKGKDNSTTYPLSQSVRTNNNTLFRHRPMVSLGQKVKKGEVLADCTSTDKGQLAIGQNVLVAFMCWSGHNFEDAIIVSERLVKDSIFTSIRIEEYECVVRDTKLGEELTTHDIPNVSEAKLKNLDEDGIIRIGAEVHENDILVGKITPKGETELTPEERLLRSIFGDKARDVKDTSMRMGHGKKGRVVGVKVFSRDQGHQLESGVIKKIYVEVAQMRNVQVGDKLAGRHGNKGVISVVLPEEDMPYMADGTPVDVILTPLGVPSRMNLGQILELHLGLAANTLNYQAVVPPFSGAREEEIRSELQEAGFPESGKVTLYDGRTGEAFDQDVAVGYMYILKLHHMIEDKMHARSVGPYSLITQQPLGGKSNSGGQRFGEMEVWALEGYGAAHTLREMLTIKSDDIIGRSKAFDAIIKGEDISYIGTPASFKVLLKYLRGLSLDVNVSGQTDDSLVDEKSDIQEVVEQ